MKTFAYVIGFEKGRCVYQGRPMTLLGAKRKRTQLATKYPFRNYELRIIK